MNNNLTFNDSTESKTILKAHEIDFKNLVSFIEPKTITFHFNETRNPSPNKNNLSEIKNNFKILKSLKDISDDENFKPFSEQHIEKVIQIISELEYQPQIFPTGRNSIQLEYEKKNGDYLEFEIYPDHIMAYKECGSADWEGKIEKEQVLILSKEFNA